MIAMLTRGAKIDSLQSTKVRDAFPVPGQRMQPSIPNYAETPGEQSTSCFHQDFKIMTAIPPMILDIQFDHMRRQKLRVMSRGPFGQLESARRPLYALNIFSSDRKHNLPAD